MTGFPDLQSKFNKIWNENAKYRLMRMEDAAAQMVQDGLLTKAEYEQLMKTSVFGFGFDVGFNYEVYNDQTSYVAPITSDSGQSTQPATKPSFGILGNNEFINMAEMPVNYQIKTGEYDILSLEYLSAISFLSNIFNNAEASFEQQRKIEGWVADFVNTLRKKATRGQVAYELKSTISDLEFLNAAMRGALVDGNGKDVSFETAFKATRGVEYSKEKIEICQLKSEAYAQADMIYRGINELVSNLEKYSYGSTDLSYIKKFNANVLKTFSMLGISTVEEINEMLTKIGKRLGVEIILDKLGSNGKAYYGQSYLIKYKGKNGSFMELTPEIAKAISTELITQLEATKRSMLDQPLDSTDEDIERYLAELKSDYKSSFREAYGDKDIDGLVEEYIRKQQNGVMWTNLGVNIGLTIASFFTGGATSLLVTGLLVTQPLQALEMATDESDETDLKAYATMLASQIPWMGAGFAIGKFGDLARSLVKLKRLQWLATKTGRSFDDMANLLTQGTNAGHVKSLEGLTNALKITRGLADFTGMTFEFTLDLLFTKLIQPEGATDQDWIMAFVGALAGSSLNKNFARTGDVTTRAAQLQKDFAVLKLSDFEAKMIIEEIDRRVASGEWEKAAAKVTARTAAPVSTVKASEAEGASTPKASSPEAEVTPAPVIKTSTIDPTPIPTVKAPEGVDAPALTIKTPKADVAPTPTIKTPKAGNAKTVVTILPAKDAAGFVVKIGDVEYTAKDFDEVSVLLKEKAPQDAEIDMSKIDLGELCAGSNLSVGSSFSAMIKNPVTYFKNIYYKKQILKEINLNNVDPKQVEYFLDQLIKRNADISSWYAYQIEYIMKAANQVGGDVIKNLDVVSDLLAKYNSYVGRAIIKFVEQTRANGGIGKVDEKALFTLFYMMNECDISEEQFFAIFNKGLSYEKYRCYDDFVYKHFSTEMWEGLAKIMPVLKDLSPEQIANLDIYKLFNLTKLEYFSCVTLADKQNMLAAIEALPENIKQKMQDLGFDIRGIEARLKVETKTTGYAVTTDKAAQKRFLNSFIISRPIMNGVTAQPLTKAEGVLASSNFRTYIDSFANVGIPLKYSRESFVKDLNALLEKLPENERAEVLKELNITINKNSFSGFIKLNDFRMGNYSQASVPILKQIRECANNFVKNNEVVCDDPEIKAILDDIVQGFPEFTSIMGKVDADHVNKLEIHILQALNEAISNPKYNLLTNEEKKILKFSILLHDLGKIEGVGGEHASASTVFARSILSKFNLNDTVQNSIINLVKYHHFAEGVYGYDFNFMFRTESEQKIAVVMAEADYSARFNKELDTHKYHTKGTKELNYSIFDAVDTFRKPGNRLMTDNNKSVSLIAPRYKYQLQNGETVEIPVMDMRKVAGSEGAANYGWHNGKTLDDTIVLVHNCSKIENVNTILESQLDPNMDITLSTRVRRLTSKDSSYGKYQLILSSTDSNIGGVFGTNIGSGGKKGFSHFIYSIFGEQQDKTAKVGLELADQYMNEILVLNPKVEQIAILDDISPEEIPIELVELSYKYKVPIIILGRKK